MYMICMHDVYVMYICVSVYDMCVWYGCMMCMYVWVLEHTTWWSGVGIFLPLWLLEAKLWWLALHGQVLIPSESFHQAILFSDNNNVIYNKRYN